MILKNLMIDRVIDLTDYDRQTGLRRFTLPEVQDFQINVTTQEDEITDATGSPIAILESAKSAEFSGNSSFTNLELLAYQSAADDNILTENINDMEIIEVLTITDGKVTLAHTPVGTTGEEIEYVYIRNSDGTSGDYMEQGTEAAAATSSAKAKFALGTNSTSGKAELSFDSSLNGTSIYVDYKFNATSGMYFESLDDKFTTSSKIVVRVLCRNVCDDNQVTVLAIVCENAKLSSAFDISFARSETHPFTYRVMPAYCGTSGKSLYKIYVLDTDDYAE